MSAHPPTPQLVDPLAEGRDALARGDWAAARAAFERSSRDGASPEALEGLGIAARWMNDPEAAMSAHEAAYRAYRERGDARGAARGAMGMAIAAYVFRTEPAVARGWLERAALLLDGRDDAPEAGWLALWRGHISLQVDRDPVGARRFSAQARAIGRTLGDVDIELLAHAQEGLALVSEGQVAEGMRRLDGATAGALSGEVTDLDAVSTACCYLIDACKRVRDYDRALQWCDHLRDFCERWSDRITFAACRTQYSDVLIWRGDWGAAEREIAANMEDLRAINEDRVTDAVARLGELRRRQGRLAEAEELLARAPRHPVATLGLSELALDTGDPGRAAERVEAHLRRLGPEARTERSAGLELLVRARLAAGEPERTVELLAELRALAAAVGTPALRASAALAEGLAAEAAGALETACDRLEEAARLFDAARGPFEAARARLALARVLDAMGRPASAGEEAGAALIALRRLGADGEARRAGELVRRLGRPAPPPATAGPLTRRERDILGRMALGQSNRDIAADLVLSVRTVERHVSSIYAKVGASGSSARAAAVAYALREGLT